MEQFKENYQNQNERMNPQLENMLKSMQSDLANNPAFPKTDANGNPINFIELIGYKRFLDVIEKVKRYTNLQNVTGGGLGQLSSMLMQGVQFIQQVEAPHKRELENLAVDLVVEEMEIPDGAFQFQCKLVPVGSINQDGFQIDGKEPNEEDINQAFQEISQDVEIPADELFEDEKHKRRFINMLIQGSSKKGHYMFELVRRKVNEYNPNLAETYGKVMSINDLLYWILDDETVRRMAESDSSMGGKEGIEEGEDGDTIIKTEAICFPISLHEIIKGIMEVFGTQGLPDDPQQANLVINAVDSLSNETMDLRLGVPCWEKIYSAYPDFILEEGNRYLQNYLFARYCALPTDEFFRVSRLILSDDPKGAKYFAKMVDEIQNDLQREDYEKNIDDINLDDLLGYKYGGGVRKYTGGGGVGKIIIETQPPKSLSNKQIRLSKEIANEVVKTGLDATIEYDSGTIDIKIIYGNKFSEGLSTGRFRVFWSRTGDNKIQYLGVGVGHYDGYEIKRGWSDDLNINEVQNFVKKDKDYYDSRKYAIGSNGGSIDLLAVGGMIDLFEDYENIPANVKSILDEYELEESDYDTLLELQNRLEDIGYTFEFGLDAEPFALRPSNVKITELQGYEDFDDSDKFNVGGEAEFDVYNWDDKMALINLGQIYEYAIELDEIINEDTQLEEWVKMKLTRIEQNIADVKHSLEGWEKYSSGGQIAKKQLLHIAKYSKDLIEMISNGSKLMSWQEGKLSVSAQSIDDIYHHLDYKMGNRAVDLENESGDKYGRGRQVKVVDFNPKSEKEYDIKEFTEIAIKKYSKKYDAETIKKEVNKNRNWYEYTNETFLNRDLKALLDSLRILEVGKTKIKYINKKYKINDTFFVEYFIFFHDKDDDIFDVLFDGLKNKPSGYYLQFRIEELKNFEEYNIISDKNISIIYGDDFTNINMLLFETKSETPTNYKKAIEEGKNKIPALKEYFVEFLDKTSDLDYGDEESEGKYVDGGFTGNSFVNVLLDYGFVETDEYMTDGRLFQKQKYFVEIDEENKNIEISKYTDERGLNLENRYQFNYSCNSPKDLIDFLNENGLKSEKFTDGGDVQGWMKEALLNLKLVEDDNSLQITHTNDDSFYVEGDSAEYRVFETYAIAYNTAIEQVREDLEENPDYFNQDWLMNWVDMDDTIENILEEYYRSYADDIADEDDSRYKNRLIAEMVENGLMTEEEATSEEANDIAEDNVDNLVDLYVEENMEGDKGINWYISNFGEDEFRDLVIDNNLIDISGASEDAIDTDGVAHFLSSYDGEEIELDNDVVAYRTN